MTDSNTEDRSTKKKSNGIPFYKGDPRINRKGRPRSFDALRELSQAISHEIVKDAGVPVIIDDHAITVAESIMRQWAFSNDPRLQMAFVEIAYGKTPNAPAEDPSKHSVLAGAVPSIPADLLAQPFVDVYRDARDRRHMEYLLKGGRGSTKSSFTSLMLVYLLVNNPGIHALAMRQVANTLRDSVFSQIVWAIDMLGVLSSFKTLSNPLEIVYLPTGQKIFFRGADKPEMIKSIKPAFGHIGILWFEELDQFRGAEAIRKIEQSVLRGGEEAWNFKTYNPPKSANNWVNTYARIPKENQLIHHSTYLQVPPEWLGKTFIDEAEHLKAVNPTAYAHEYLGEVTGTGGMVFENVVARTITDDEIAQFDQVGQGVDWGYFPDPFAWSKSHFDANRRILYIFDEFKALKMSNREVYDYLVEHKGYTPDQMIIADSAEPKSIADFREYGANCRGAEKGPESVNYSMKWLQTLSEIVIDPVRCPNHLEEFLNYELEQDRDGEYISAYPDHDNHFIDAVRYRTNLLWRRRGV